MNIKNKNSKENSIMDTVDLTYYYALPQNQFSCPKFLVSEITKEIEYAACTDFYDTVFEYSYYKLCEKFGLKHRPVMWGSDLNESDKYVTITNYSIDDEYCHYGDLEEFEKISNQLEVETHLLFIDLFGGNVYSNEICGIIENGEFVKMFSSTAFFEFELSMFLQGDSRKNYFNRNNEYLLQEVDKQILFDLKPWIDKLANISRKELNILFDFPETPKYDKAKKWIIDKIISVQKDIKKVIT
jgi:hypothetical protein